MLLNTENGKYDILTYHYLTDKVIDGSNSLGKWIRLANEVRKGSWCKIVHHETNQQIRPNL